MMRRTFVALVMLFGSTAAFAQSAPLKLDAVAGVPQLDEKTQTEDISFRTGRDDRLTVPVARNGGYAAELTPVTP